MTVNRIPAGASFPRRRSSATSAGALPTALLLPLLGATLMVFNAIIRWPLHLPGWHGLVLMAFMVGAKRAARSEVAASLIGVGGCALTLLSPWPLFDPMAGVYLLLAGLALDGLVYVGIDRTRSPAWVWALWGALAWLVHPLLAPLVAGEGGHVQLLIRGQWYPLATHLAFGLVGSGLGALLAGGPLSRLKDHERRRLRRRGAGRGVSWMMIVLLPLPLVPWRKVRAATRDSSAYSLGEIEVPGSGMKTAVAGTRRTVTAREIRQRGARTLDQAIELLPGVNVREGGQGTPRIDVRGLRTRQVKLLINGVPFNSTYDGQFDPRLIPTNDIARIELIAGPSSVLYGDGGMAAVINIVTRKGLGRPHGRLSAEAGSGQYNRESGSIGGGTRWGSYFLSFDHAQRNGFPLSSGFTPTTVQGAGLRDNSDARSTNFYGNFGADPLPDLHLGLTVTRTTGDHGIPPSTIDNHADPFAQPPKYERIQDLGGYSVQLASLWSPRGPWSLRSWVYLNTQHLQDNRYDSSAYDSISDPHIKNTYLIHRSTRIAGFHLQPSLGLGRYGRVSLALDGRQAYWRDTGVIRDQSQGGGSGGGGGGGGGGHGKGGGGSQQTYGLRSLDSAWHVNYGTAALQYKARWGSRLTTTLGYGWTSQWRQGGTSEGASLLSVGARWRLNRRTELRADFGRKVQFPTLRQLYDPVSGNTSLHAQTAELYEVGVNRTLPEHSRVRLTGFISQVHGYIEKDQVSNLFENYSHYVFRGVEVAATTRPGDGRLMVRLSYTYLYSQDLSPGSSKQELQYRPQQSAALIADYRIGDGFAVNATAHFVGRQAYYSRRTPVQKAFLPTYTIVNVKLSKSLLSRALTVFVGARNLLDKNYADSYGFPQAGRFVYGGARLRF